MSATKAGFAEVTPDQVMETVNSFGIEQWRLRNCTICCEPLFYIFAPNGVVYFDSGCGCSGRSNLQQRTYEDVARTFNIQKPEVRTRMWSEFVACGARSQTGGRDDAAA